MKKDLELHPPVSTAWLAGLFVFGGLAHVLLLQWVAHRFIGQDPRVASYLVAAQFVIGISSGGFIALLMGRLLKNARRLSCVSPSRLLLRASARGVLATFLALELFYISASFYSTILLLRGTGANSASHALGAFILLFVEFQTYGVFAILLCAPFSALVGIIAGFAILADMKKRINIA